LPQRFDFACRKVYIRHGISLCAGLLHSLFIDGGISQPAISCAAAARTIVGGTSAKEYTRGLRNGNPMPPNTAPFSIKCEQTVALGAGLWLDSGPRRRGGHAERRTQPSSGHRAGAAPRKRRADRRGGRPQL